MAQKSFAPAKKVPIVPPKTILRKQHNCYLLLVSKSRSYPHGSLLRSLGEGKYCKYESKNELSGEILCTPDEVAELSFEESKLLDAIYDPGQRCTVYHIKGLLAWGTSLRVGDSVLAQLPDSSGTIRRGSISRRSRRLSEIPVTSAIIRYIGNISTNYGEVHRFGVEIEVC